MCICVCLCVFVCVCMCVCVCVCLCVLKTHKMRYQVHETWSLNHVIVKVYGGGCGGGH